MSSTEETRAVVERMYRAGVDMDAEAFMDCIHPDCELVEPAWLPYGGVHKGADALARIFGEVAKIIDLPTIEVDEIVADGDTAVGFFHAKLLNGVTTHNAEKWTVKDGKVWKGEVWYQDPTPVLDMLSKG